MVDDITEHRKAEDALRESEERLRRITENMLDMVVETDLQGVCRYASSSAKTVLGYDPKDLVGKSLFDRVHPEDLATVRETVQRAISTGRLWTGGRLECRYRHADGHYIWLENLANILYDEKGQMLGSVIGSRDISERKRAEEALKEAHQFNRAIISGAREGIIVYDQDLNYRVWNRFMEELTGMPAEKVLGKNALELFPHLHQQGVDLLLKRALLGETVASPDTQFHVPGTCKSGWVSGIYGPHRDAHGEIIGVTGLVRDVTERKRMDEKLRESEGRLKDAQALGRIGSWEFEVESGRIAWSDETYKLYERDPALGPPTAEEEATYYSPEQAFRLREYARRAIAEGTDFRYDLEAELPNGRHVFYSATMRPVKDVHGRVVKLFGTVQDITERKRMEDDIKSLAKFPSENPNPILRLDRRGKVLIANRASKTLLQEWNCEPGQTAPELWCNLVTEVLSTGQSRNLDIESGDRCYTFLVKPIVEAGHVNFYGRDITERKLAEQKLRLQSEITENMFEGVVLTRASDGVIVYANPRFEQIFGYDPGELIGKNIALVNAPVKGKSPEDIVREIETSLNESGAWVGEIHNVKKDGALFWCRVSTSVLESSEYGRIWVSVQEDITESKRTGEKLDAIHKHSVQLGAENSIDEVVTSTLDAMEYTLGFHYAGFEEVKDGFLRIREARGIPASLEPLSLDGPGVIVRVARTKEAIRISDTRSEPAFVDTRTKSPSGQPVQMLSELAVPVVVNGSVVAVLNVESAQLGAFTESDQVLLETLAMHVSSAIARLEQIEALRSRAEELGTLQATVLDITAPYDLSTLLERIVERAVRLLEAKSGGMYLCDPERHEARCVVSYNTPHDYRGVVLKYGEGAAGRVAETGKPLMVNDYRLWEGRAEVYEKERPFSALLSAPMIWQDRVIGIIHVMEESKARRFTQADLEMLMLFANHATIAVERTRTEEALEESEERFRGIAERSFDPIFMVDLEGSITYASPAVERITGYSQRELLGASFQKFLPESEKSNWIRILSEAVKGDVATSGETNILKKDGSTVRLEFAGSPILKDGKLAGLQGIARDVTERKRMETALKESEERYRMMFRSMGDAVSVYEAVDQGNDFVFKDFNEAAERIEKVKSEDVIGRSVVKVFPGVKDLGLFQVFQRVWKTGKPEHLPAGIYKDKRIVGWRENYVYKLPSGELVAVYQDVTDRKRLEEELRQYSLHLESLVNERTTEVRSARERLEYVISSNPAVIFTGRPRPDLSDYDATYMSKRTAELTGFKPDEFINHPEVWEHRVNPDDYSRYLTAVQRLWKTGHLDVEYRFLHKDGKERWLREEAYLVRDAAGKPLEVIGYWTDMTVGRRMTEELRAARERLEYVVTSNPAVIYAAKPLADHSDFVLTYVSGRVVSMLGFEPQEFVGHPEFWERHVPPEDVCRVLTEIPRLWKEGHHTFEYRFLCKNGAYRWIREEANVVHDTDGKAIEVNGYWTDVTERKRLEEELVKSQRLATIGETTAMVGHDLRNPLQGISGIVYLAKRNLESRKAADRKAAESLLDTIQEQITYMDKIVSDLQDYSQPLAPKLTETNLPNLIRQTLSTIKIPEAVKVAVGIERPAENVMIDPTLMRRTLTNLGMNAIQAMPKKGKLTIRARSKGDSTIITVEDTGAGIPRKNLARMFSPFFTTKAKGQGLGLAVCKRLVEAQGGTITVKSKPRKGTTFTIKLPRGRKEVAS